MNTLTPTRVNVPGAVSMVAAGSAFRCALVTTGTVWCWGQNTDGQLGNGTTSPSAAPVQVSSLTGVTAIAAGTTHACALKRDGTVWCWGKNDYAQLAKPTVLAAMSSIPESVAGITGATLLAAGTEHTCASTPSGVFCWGRGAEYQLGSNDTANEHIPTQALATPVTRLALGNDHSCAVVNERVSCWGSNGAGQLGNGSTGAPVGTPALVSSLNGVLDAAAGDDFTCVVLRGGRVLCFGERVNGALGALPTSGHGTSFPQASPLQLRGIPQATGIYAGSSTACITAGTALWCWGSNTNGLGGVGEPEARFLPAQVRIAQTSTSVSTGCAVAAGKVYCWGQNIFATAGSVGAAALAPVWIKLPFAATSVAASPSHVCALANKRVYCWGSNLSGQLGDGTTTLRTAPVQVPGITDALTVSVASNLVAMDGSGHTCITRQSGQVWCWGANDDGQLGDGTTTSRVSPVRAGTLASATTVATATSHSCAINAWRVYCWGAGSLGQLGDGSLGNSLAPMQIPTPDPATHVAASGFRTCAVSDGKVFCWGSDATYTNQQDTPTLVAGITAGASQVAVSPTHACALRYKEVWCWGYAGAHLGFGPTDSAVDQPAARRVTKLQPATAVAVDSERSCAIVSNRAVCWGTRLVGHLGEGAGSFAPPRQLRL
jgi:alpha-tubulin suppressor-like RCC1 family protein